MKKRILTTLLLGTLVLTLAGCGSKPEVAPQNSGSATTAETPIQNAEPTGDVNEAETPAQDAKEDAISDTFYQMITDQVYVLSVTKDGNYWANYSDEATYPLELNDTIQADLDAYFTENNLADQGVYELAFKDDVASASIYRVKFIPVDGKMPMFEGNTVTSEKAAEYDVNYSKRFVEEGIAIPTYSEIVKDLGSNGVLCELSGTNEIESARFAWYIEDTNELLTISFNTKTGQAGGNCIYKQREVGGTYFDKVK